MCGAAPRRFVSGLSSLVAQFLPAIACACLIPIPGLASRRRATSARIKRPRAEGATASRGLSGCLRLERPAGAPSSGSVGSSAGFGRRLCMGSSTSMARNTSAARALQKRSSNTPLRCTLTTRAIQPRPSSSLHVSSGQTECGMSTFRPTSAEVPVSGCGGRVRLFRACLGASSAGGAAAGSVADGSLADLTFGLGSLTDAVDCLPRQPSYFSSSTSTLRCSSAATVFRKRTVQRRCLASRITASQPCPRCSVHGSFGHNARGTSTTRPTSAIVPESGRVWSSTSSLTFGWPARSSFFARLFFLLASPSFWTAPVSSSARLSAAALTKDSGTRGGCVRTRFGEGSEIASAASAASARASSSSIAKFSRRRTSP
mmetsp:Transcript_51423/g.171641  ORF Transcript_51423/g.171641 Transcript_51423/m.171641 type:complete len:373 (-) Transcript_51423:7-1125(-)